MKFGLSTTRASLAPTRTADRSPGTRRTAALSPSIAEHFALYPGAASARSPSRRPADRRPARGRVSSPPRRRILLGTGVLLVPYHQPVVLAKRLATIDVLSKGRMRLLTVGVGGLPGEAAAVGVDFATRGRRADEAIDVLRLLWSVTRTGSASTGNSSRSPDVCSFPKPPGAPRPVHVGGSSRAAARRAGLRGDGYFPGGGSPIRGASQLDLMRTTARAAGRDADARRTPGGDRSTSRADLDTWPPPGRPAWS